MMPRSLLQDDEISRHSAYNVFEGQSHRSFSRKQPLRRRATAIIRKTPRPSRPPEDQRPSPLQHYSMRRAFTGSIEAAFRAGIMLAMSAQHARATIDPRRTTGSQLLTR